MKNKTITLSDALKVDSKRLTEFIDLWKKMGSTYHWKAPKDKNSRAFQEQKYSDIFKIELEGKTIIATVETRVTSFFSSKREIYVNGEKKQITVLNKLLKEVEQYPHSCPFKEVPLLINTKFEETARERLLKGQ